MFVDGCWVLGSVMGPSLKARCRFEANKPSGDCGEEASWDHLFPWLLTRRAAQQFLPMLCRVRENAKDDTRLR